MPRALVLIAALFLLLAAGATAKAQEDEPFRRTTAVYGIVGLGTPVGGDGLELVQRLGSLVELTAGVGVGMTAVMAHNGSPLQWAVMPRLRIGDENHINFTFGAGMSGGNIGDIPIACDEYCDPPQTSYPVHYVLWTNVEIGTERWWRNGFALRAFLGYAHGWQTAAPSSTLDLPYIGTGFGYAF